MLLLEGSDALLRFRVRERINGVLENIDFDDYDVIQLIIKFANDKILYVQWEPETEAVDSIVDFSIFSEQTTNRVGSLTADIWGIKGQKKVRFNQKTIKWKVLPSIKVPKWATNAGL